MTTQDEIQPKSKICYNKFIYNNGYGNGRSDGYAEGYEDGYYDAMQDVANGS